MEVKRKSFQGVYNIIRFNWHFYLVASLMFVSLILLKPQLPEVIQSLVFWLVLLLVFTITVSLLISFYIYDISDLYQFNWLKIDGNKSALSINAGFDEMSEIIKNKYSSCDLIVCDFYDPDRHTEISIKRARKAYPLAENTIQITTEELPFSNDVFDYSLAFLSAHEIRDKEERIVFFKELNRVVKPDGQIFITEHLRDLNNFLAYSAGFFHFHSKSDWLCTFDEANLIVKQEIKTTPFITTFILEKNGDTL